MIFTKNTLLKIISLLVVISSLFLCSCTNISDDDSVVMRYEDKIISKDMYNCYLQKNKENIVSTYKSNFQAYPEYFKAYFGFQPEDNDEYWNSEFWNEKLSDKGMTAKEYLNVSTQKACKEYLVYEKISKDFNYKGLPQEILKQFEDLKNENIKKYGSYESWNVFTIGQYGITADELMSLSKISFLGTVLPEHIFGAKGKDISDEIALAALKDSLQFKYSVYYYQSVDLEEDVTEDSSTSIDEEKLNVSDDSDLNKENSNDSQDSSEEISNDSQDSSEDVSNDSQDLSEDVSNDSQDSSEEVTVEDYNKHYNEKMHTNYNDVLSGKKTFEEVYKDSDDYKYLNEKAPNGVVLTIEDFNKYFSLKNEEYKINDIYIAENDSGIFLIQIVDFTSEYIEAKKEYLVADLFEELLETYFSEIKIDEKLLASLNT